MVIIFVLKKRKKRRISKKRKKNKRAKLNNIRQRRYAHWITDNADKKWGHGENFLLTNEWGQDRLLLHHHTPTANQPPTHLLPCCKVFTYYVMESLASCWLVFGFGLFTPNYAYVVVVEFFSNVLELCILIPKNKRILRCTTKWRFSHTHFPHFSDDSTQSEDDNNAELMKMSIGRESERASVRTQRQRQWWQASDFGLVDCNAKRQWYMCFGDFWQRVCTFVTFVVAVNMGEWKTTFVYNLSTYFTRGPSFTKMMMGAGEVRFVTNFSFALFFNLNHKKTTLLIHTTTLQWKFQHIPSVRPASTIMMINYKVKPHHTSKRLNVCHRCCLCCCRRRCRQWSESSASIYLFPTIFHQKLFTNWFSSNLDLYFVLFWFKQ